MNQASIERLREYLAQLPPQSQALLMREFERALERGQDIAVSAFVLEQLRTVVRGADDSIANGVEADDDTQPRTEDPARLFYRSLEPFLVEGNFPIRPGQIRRASLLPVWQWLAREGAPEAVREFEDILAKARETGASVEPAVRRLQVAAAQAIISMAMPVQGDDRYRTLARVGGPSVVEDFLGIGLALQARDALEALGGKMPAYLRGFTETQIAEIVAALNVPSLQSPQVLPFALSLIIQRLTAPWQIIRLAVKMAASDDELRVAATPFGVAVTMALHDLYFVAACLRTDIRRGQLDDVADQLKTLHDGVRGLRTELDLRNDSAWGKQLASIRAEISNSLQSEIESVPGRVRRILRPRADKDILAGLKIDPSEVEETAALIDFVAVCRTYASELAINEVTLRTYSDLQHYVEQSTEALVQSLRNERGRAYREQQVKAAIRFCEVLFGTDYSSLMSRAAENAVVVDRKPAKAGQQK